MCSEGDCQISVNVLVQSLEFSSWSPQVLFGALVSTWHLGRMPVNLCVIPRYALLGDDRETVHSAQSGGGSDCGHGKLRNRELLLTTG